MLDIRCNFICKGQSIVIYVILHSGIYSCDILIWEFAKNESCIFSPPSYMFIPVVEPLTPHTTPPPPNIIKVRRPLVVFMNDI